MLLPLREQGVGGGGSGCGQDGGKAGQDDAPVSEPHHFSRLPG
jgi:hypothetical protein